MYNKFFILFSFYICFTFGEIDKVKIVYEDQSIKSNGNENKILSYDVTRFVNASVEKVPEQTIPERPCKEELVPHRGYLTQTPLYSMRNETLNHEHHVTLTRNSTGHLTYFEMHFALHMWSRGYVNFKLLENERDTTDTQSILCIGEGSFNVYTSLSHKMERVQYIATPDILSTTQFRAFYLIISDGNLKFGKEGDSTPLISCYFEDFALLNFYKLVIWAESEATIRYCPTPIEGI